MWWRRQIFRCRPFALIGLICSPLNSLTKTELTIACEFSSACDTLKNGQSPMELEMGSPRSQHPHGTHSDVMYVSFCTSFLFLLCMKVTALLSVNVRKYAKLSVGMEARSSGASSFTPLIITPMPLPFCRPRPVTSFSPWNTSVAVPKLPQTRGSQLDLEAFDDISHHPRLLCLPLMRISSVL